MMEFHVSRQSRDRFAFDQSIFSYDGNVILANFHAARQFAQKINQKRDLVSFPEKAVKAGQINAMGLIDEILHHVLALYRRQNNPQVMEEALKFLQSRVGTEQVEQCLALFIYEFPPLAVYRRELSAEDYLKGSTESHPNRALVLEELIMLWVENKNPALSDFDELFSDNKLAGQTAYLQMMAEIHDFFETQPVFGPDHQNLVDMLRSPAVAVPYSITGQLEYIRTRWSELLGRFLYRLLSSMDLIKEEEKLPFHGPGPVPIPVYGWEAGMLEAENFSQDREWMPQLVLIAKNAYVWLDQLSKKYALHLTRLDQIPDAELDSLSRWGFSGLWLIGLWERSKASARIKQLCGNQEAIASAYSLAGYQIAAELGGEEAFHNLRDRAWQRGIRLASDMVPNHMGIDSPWVIEHPDWFIALDDSPFPSYSFNGVDLSPDGRVTIQIEDHYFERTDAAVVFKRYDHSSNRTQYIYHGNDGTSMPWNDTAQLNYLNPEVREAVIQTILSVARRFPIIRFDAAMTLAKRHYQRLWFPEPGAGGDIPSRAGMGLTKEQFDQAMPVEFWREVVDRIAMEAPDTLLLAEAFWLMEGYFVRTLGMHRVYNSAFMNMMRNEDNAKYRLVMKNTLEFDPEVMKRFVNFMNNPDERTAVDQFGKDNKYFGICAVMSTLPGLPMFGHGQVEGFSEKYGMEFRRAYWDEKPDPWLVERHEREIFPLLHQRAMFAGVDNFLLYDFFTPEGHVDENVFAYSNGIGDQRALVVFHNKFASTRGWIRTSAAFSVKTASGDRVLTQRTIAEGLGIQPAIERYVIFRDQINRLEFIRRSFEISENGFYVQLDAYQYHVFTDFRIIEDDAGGSYRRIYEILEGRGVPSIQDALHELVLQPIQQPFRQIANPGYLKFLLDSRLNQDDNTLPEHLLTEAGDKAAALLAGILTMSGQSVDEASLIAEIRTRLMMVLSLNTIGTLYPMPKSKRYRAALEFMRTDLGKDTDPLTLSLFIWAFLAGLGKCTGQKDHENQAISWIEEWQLHKTFGDCLSKMELKEDEIWKAQSILRLLITQQSWFSRKSNQPLPVILSDWLSQSEVQRFLGVNRYNDILWYNQEAFDAFLRLMVLAAVLETASVPQASAAQVVETALAAHDIILRLQSASIQAKFQVNRLIEFCGAENN